MGFKCISEQLVVTLPAAWKMGNLLAASPHPKQGVSKPTPRHWNSGGSRSMKPCVVFIHFDLSLCVNLKTKAHRLGWWWLLNRCAGVCKESEGRKVNRFQRQTASLRTNCKFADKLQLVQTSSLSRSQFYPL